MRNTCIVLLAVTTLCMASPTFADGPIRLAAALPAVEASNGQPSPTAVSRGTETNILTGKVGDKVAYNAQLLGLTAAIAADDAGIQKTLFTKDGSSGHNFANDVTKMGDLKYVAPALGLVYLSGGTGNQRLASHAALAAVKAGAVGLVLKYAIGRQRPGAHPGATAATFKPGSSNNDNNSFPSGHTLIAFSVATVWAHERPNERYLAYGLASLVGLSRVSLSAHWPTDVLVGAAVGVSQGRQVNNGNTELFSLRF